jgi:hypothetical protein
MEDIEYAYEKMASTISEEIPFDEIMDLSIPVDVLLAEKPKPNISEELPSGIALPCPGPEYYYNSELSEHSTLLSWYKHYKNYFNKSGNI